MILIIDDDNNNNISDAECINLDTHQRRKRTCDCVPVGFDGLQELPTLGPGVAQPLPQLARRVGDVGQLILQRRKFGVQQRLALFALRVDVFGQGLELLLEPRFVCGAAHSTQAQPLNHNPTI